MELERNEFHAQNGPVSCQVLAGIMADLRTEFVSCQFHPLYGSLSRNRGGTHEFLHRPSSIVHRLSGGTPLAASETRSRHVTTPRSRHNATAAQANRNIEHSK